jgi:hypothetical protein
MKLPAELDVPVVEALAPYNAQVVLLNKQIGTVPPRQSMKDTSGASQMDPTTQVSSLHGVSMLQATQYPVEGNIALALLQEPGGPNDRALVNVAVGAELNLYGQPALAAAQAAREAGNAPNAVLAAAAAIVGPRRAQQAQAAVRGLIDLFAPAGLTSALDESFDVATLPKDDALIALLTGTGNRMPGRPQCSTRWRRAAPARSSSSIWRAFRFAHRRRRAGRDLRHAGLGPADAQAHLASDGGVAALVAAPVRHADRCLGACRAPRAGRLLWRADDRGPAEALADRHVLPGLFGREPEPADHFALQTLVGLLLTNGPGSITAQGAKGAVSADGPETPQRVQLNKALIGFLTHSGYTHGGNGYEGVAFLLERFSGEDLRDPGDKSHGIDLHALALRFAQDYAKDKAARKEIGGGGGRAIPCINHPVFKDRPVNIDPREEYVAQPARQPRRVQHLPRLLPHPGAGTRRRRRDAQRVLRQRRRSDCHATAQGAVGTVPGQETEQRAT